MNDASTWRRSPSSRAPVTTESHWIQSDWCSRRFASECELRREVDRVSGLRFLDRAPEGRQKSKNQKMSSQPICVATSNFGSSYWNSLSELIAPTTMNPTTLVHVHPCAGTSKHFSCNDSCRFGQRSWVQFECGIAKPVLRKLSLAVLFFGKLNLRVRIISFDTNRKVGKLSHAL